MVLMVTCGLLLVTAVALAVRWRRHTLTPPSWVRDGGGVVIALRGLAWLLGVAVVTGLLVGVLVVGPAGRLAMRLLAATSPDAQGRITDAGEVVGEISLSGTIGFFVFVGLPVGLGVGIAYALASWVLPRGMLGGALLGTALLVVLGSRLDPLREENADFDILGPGWLSVVVFVAMALVTGVITAPIAGRVGLALARPRPWWLAWLLPAGLAVTAVLLSAPAALALVVVAGAGVLAALLLPPERREAVWLRVRRVLQAALAATVAVGAPGFLSAVATIAG